MGNKLLTVSGNMANSDNCPLWVCNKGALCYYRHVLRLLEFPSLPLSLTNTYLKYSDNTDILTLLTDNHSALDFHNTVAHFNQWCKNKHFNLM